MTEYNPHTRPIVSSYVEAMCWLTLIMSDWRPADDPKDSALHKAVEEVVSIVWKEGEPVMALRPIKHTLVQSTNVRSLGYDPEASILEVQFKSGGVYRYYDIPQDLYDSFLSSPSKGQFHRFAIKGQFKYNKIADRPKGIPYK